MAGAAATVPHRAVLEAELLQLDRRTRPATPPPAASEGRLERRLAVGASFVVFSVTGYLASVVGVGMPGDALSRVTQAQAAVVGRDPHLEAIGFVWGPFPTMFQVPLVAARSLWAPLTSHGMAAVLVSALCMAGVVGQLLAWGAECGTRRWLRGAVVILLVAHPLLWTNGVNGMSEACWLFFVLVAMRHLARWSTDDDTRSLVIVGAALAAAYLTRYETAAVVLAVAVFVAGVSLRRPTSGPSAAPARVRQQAVADVLVALFPVVAAMIVWALASWLIVGEPFPQFSSAYGNSALVERGAAGTAELIGDASTPGRVRYFLGQSLVAAPFLALLVPLAFCWGRRTSAQAAAALTVLGAPLLLQLVLAGRGSTFPWFRYVLLAVVLSAALAMAVGGALDEVRTPANRWLLAAVVLLVLVPGIAWSHAAIVEGRLASFDQRVTYDALDRAIHGEPTDPDDPAHSDRSPMAAGGVVAADVDARVDAEAGTVLVDQASISVLGAAPRPEVYVLQSDRDVDPALAAPATFGVRYLLVPDPGAGTQDQIHAEYPGLWDDGAGIAELADEWGDGRDPATHFRLFAVVDPDPVNRPSPDQEFLR